MPSTIVLKHSSVASSAPSTGDLTVTGEVALNLADKRFYARDNSNNIILIGVQDGTSDGNTLIWDATTGAWVETNLITVSDAGLITINGLGGIVISNLATSDPVNAGEIWNDSGTLKVSAG